jgi:hypothetical protein
MFLSYSWTALQSQMKDLLSSALVEYVIHVLVSSKNLKLYDLYLMLRS